MHFLIKLRPQISEHLASRDFDFKSVQNVIEIAERYDKQFGLMFPGNRTTAFADPFCQDRAMLKLSNSTGKWNSERPMCSNCSRIGHFKKVVKPQPWTTQLNNNATKKKLD